jgi:ubiquinone biosynthesis protein COQ9
MKDDAALKTRIVLAMLPDVPFEGWSRAALRKAADKLGHDEAELGSLFPSGARDAVACFSAWAERETEKALAKKKMDALKVRERIALGVKTRLDILAPHREAVRRMIAFLALPANLPLAARLLYRTTDAIWFAAGDRATDFSFYTKRGLLAGVYASTTLYWLDDKSKDGEATSRFLDRRINEVMQIPKIRGRIQQGLGSVPNPLRALRALRRRAV